MFNFSKKLFARPINYTINKYFFSKEQTHYQQLKHQAIIAQKIISMIAQPNLFSETMKLENSNSNLLQGNQPSLRQNIINYISNYKAIEAEENPMIKYAKSQILTYFLDGVIVDQDFCGPPRFVELQQNRNFAQQSSKGKKLHFCPTYLVTGSLFRKIMYKNQMTAAQRKRYLLIKGQYGIGKSFSALLYKMLSDHIYRWRFYKIQNKNSTKVTDQEDLHKFIGPKLIYCIITPAEDDIKSIERKILKQCFQFEQDATQKWKGKFLYQKKGEVRNDICLKQEYQKIDKNFKLCIMYDQIDQQAKIFRIQNLLTNLQSNKKLSKNEILKIIKQKTQRTLNFNQLQQLFNRNNKIIQIRMALYNSFNQILYLCSNNMEQIYQKYLNLIPDIINKEVVKKYTISFPSSISSPSAISDTIQFILLGYQNTQRLKNHLLLSKNINLQRDKIQYSQVLNQFRNSLHNQFIQTKYFITPQHLKLFTQTLTQQDIMTQTFYQNDFLQKLVNYSEVIQIIQK